MTDVAERVKTYQQFIGGEWVDSASGQTLDVENPADGQVIAKVQASSAEDVDRAANAAEAAFETWGKTTPQERSIALLKLADAIEGRAEELGRLESKNAGKPVGAAIDEIPVVVDNLRFFAGAARLLEGKAANEYMADHTSFIRREPVGVVASIAPWNYPIMMAGWKIGPALAAGNTVILKPSARTPLTALVLAELAADILPPGVLNVITGTGAGIGDDLVGHPKVGMVSVTGDTDTGKHIARVAAEKVKRLHLELGGKAPVIIFDDADSAAVAEALKLWGYWNAGQDCTAATRVIAGPKIYDKFVADLSREVKTIKWGNPAEGDDIEMGSLIAKSQADKVEGMVDRARAGAEVTAGGHAARPTGRLLRADRHRRPGPEERDRAGRGLRAGRHRAAVLGRGPGHQVGERRPLRARGLRLDRRRGTRDARRQGASSSGPSGSTTTSCWSARCRTAASRSPATARTSRCTRVEDYTVVKHVMLKI